MRAQSKDDPTAQLNLSVAEVLSTTRAVRRRLDLDRPVDPDILRECLALALQAPSPSDEQGWHFIVVTDPEQRATLANLYRAGATARGIESRWEAAIAGASNHAEVERHRRRAASGRHLIDHLHRVPVMIIPCLTGRPEGLPSPEQAAFWAGIWPGVWSFMLAARARGLGTALTTLHLVFEEQAADTLGIDYRNVTQAGLVPAAHTIGTTFRPAARRPLDDVVHWDHW